MSEGDDEHLLRIEGDDWWIALLLEGGPTLAHDIEEIQGADESLAHTRKRLASARLALTGSAIATSEYGGHHGFVAVDPKTRSGVFVLTYETDEVKEGPVRDVDSIRDLLEARLMYQAQDLIDMCGGDCEPSIEFDIPEDLASW